jgi:hypothetical protein
MKRWILVALLFFVPALVSGQGVSRHLLASEAPRVVGAAGQPAFGGSWANYDVNTYARVAFYKDALGDVVVVGTVGSGSAGTVFTLPVGYRPLKNIQFGLANGATTAARATVGSNGTVAIDAYTTWASFAGIRFRAGQ